MRQKAHKNSAKYLKANIKFMFCVINATVNTLTERFLRDEKILMLSSSVVYLSFAILSTFENRKGVIKILVYSSVIDINQMDVIFNVHFFGMTTSRGRAIVSLKARLGPFSLSPYLLERVGNI